MKRVIIYFILFNIFIGVATSLAAALDEVILKGKVISFDGDFLRLKDSDNKVLIVPKKFAGRSVHEGDQIELNLTEEQFQQVKLKLKN